MHIVQILSIFIRNFFQNGFFTLPKIYTPPKKKTGKKKGENESKKYIMKIKTKREIVKNM